jgi:hypothetical protein
VEGLRQAAAQNLFFLGFPEKRKEKEKKKRRLR